MFQKNLRVTVTDCLVIHGRSPWQDRVGRITQVEPGKTGRRWIWVLLDDDPTKSAIPFRESEISEASQTFPAQRNSFRAHKVGS